MSSKQRRAFYKEPGDDATEKEWLKFSDQYQKLHGNRKPPWIEQREWLDDVKPDLAQLEKSLSACEMMKNQGYGSEALTELTGVLQRLVTACIAVRELPRNSKKPYDELQDLNILFRRVRATYLRLEPDKGRQWIKFQIVPPYKSLTPQLKEETGEWTYSETDFVETVYELWRDLPMFFDESTGTHTYHRPEGVDLFIDWKHVPD